MIKLLMFFFFCLLLFKFTLYNISITELDCLNIYINISLLILYYTGTVVPVYTFDRLCI